jgi:hypothetical protein
MSYSLSTEHKHYFEQIRKDLSLVGAKETNFVTIELLFYDALKTARTYGNDLYTNHLLAALKRLQANEYMQSKLNFKKSSQRERMIRRFVSQLRLVLLESCKH